MGKVNKLTASPSPHTAIKIENIQDLIVEIRGQKAIVDADVAGLYGVETKRINEAVKNNPDKFPDGYILDLKKGEWDALKSKFSTSIRDAVVKSRKPRFSVIPVKTGIQGSSTSGLPPSRE